MKSPETLIERYTAAAMATDRDALMALYAPGVRIFDMMMPWQVRGAVEWEPIIDDWFTHAGTGSDVKASDVEVKATDGMALLTMNMFYGNIGADDEQESMVNRLTWIAVPDGDDWKIIHEHTSVPLSNEDMSPVYAPS